MTFEQQIIPCSDGLNKVIKESLIFERKSYFILCDRIKDFDNMVRRLDSILDPIIKDPFYSF